MSDSITFINTGLIDQRCITIIGVSVKVTENPVGFFGTGLKYAIAIILRAGGKITIWRGLEELRFDSVEVVVRGCPVQVVRMNGQELGFTTDLGKHWKMWQAFREIYCNTVDEGGDCVAGTVNPKEAVTTIHVELAEFAECLTKIGDFILQTTPIFSTKTIEFHVGPSNSVFYRSIRVADTVANKPFLFLPNLIEKMELTEDRTLKENWQLFHILARSILESSDRDFLLRWLSAGREFAEHYIDIDYQSINPSDAFFDIAETLSMDVSRPLNLSALKVLSRKRALTLPVEADLMITEQRAVRNAVTFCRALKYPVDEFPIVVVESLGEGILGRADVEARRILIARQSIQMGTNHCAVTLIEEWAHIKHGFKDCERPMQNWLFDQIAKLGEAYLYEANTNRRFSADEYELSVAKTDIEEMNRSETL